MSRDLVRTVPGERVDHPDYEAGQRNGRSDLRASLSLSLLRDPSSHRLISGWNLAGLGTSSLTVTAGRAVLSEILDDGTEEFGVVADDFGTPTKAVSLAGLPANMYNVYLKFQTPAGVPGNRVFYSPTAGGTEVSQTINTRRVYDWTVEVALVSPGAGYKAIGTVAWNGGAITEHKLTDPYLFEGTRTQPPTEWGGGVNDRDTDRTLAPINSVEMFAAMTRRQLADMIGNAWYSVPPTTLQAAASHIATSTNPHGATLTQDTLISTVEVQINSGAILDVDGSADFANGLVVHDNILLAGSLLDALPIIDSVATNGSESGYTAIRAVSASSFKTEDPGNDRAVDHFWGPERAYFVAAQTGGLATNDAAYVLDINDLFNGVELSGEGPYLAAIQIRGYGQGATTGVDTCFWELKRTNMATGVSTALASGSFSKSDFGTSPGGLQTCDISAVATADRKMTAYYTYQLVLNMRAEGNTGTVPDEYGVAVTGAVVTVKHKFLHP